MLQTNKKYCSVLTCVNYYNFLGERCFSFPRNKKSAQDWVLAINNPNLNLEYAHTYHRTKGVCHRHFANHQFTTSARVRLNRGVVPTLCLPSRDNCENGLSASELQKVFLSSARKGRIYRFAKPVVQNHYQPEEADVEEDSDTGTCEEAGSQLLPSVDSEMHSSECSNVRYKQPSQKVQERAEMPVQEDSQLEDILTESSTIKYANLSRNQTDLQSVNRKPMVDVADPVVDGGELYEMCDTESYEGNTDDYEDIKSIPNESYMVATDTWENLPNQVCRLCASMDEHPKQSIVRWLAMLNEIIPDLVAVDDGLPQHVCRPCTNKLYTCNKIKTDFVEAYKKLQECFGFTKSPGIQFIHLAPVMSSHQVFNESTEADLVSEVEEQFVPGDEEQLESEVDEQSLSQVVKPLVSDVEVQLVSDAEEHLMTETEEHLMTEAEEHLMSEAEEHLMTETEEHLMTEAEEHLITEAEEHLITEAEEHLITEAEEHLITEAEENLVSVVPSDISCGVLKTSNKDLLKCKEPVLNVVDKLSIKIQESVISCTDNGANVHGNITNYRPDSAHSTSHVCKIKVQKVERRKKKYKYVCGECEEMFTIKGALSRHKRTHFRVVFKCDYCDKHCTSLTQLNEHKRIHTKELPFMCEVCGKCFRTAVNLSNHKYVHKPPIYTCEVCNKKCSSRVYLTQHKKVHSSDTKLICEVCGKIIYTPFSLKIHMRTHTGEKPFQCAACGRCFISAARLKTHRLVHTDRKFQCFTCGKEYYFKSSLIKHQECHNTLREYRCPICFTLFANSDNMRRHGKVYCKPPLCTVCGQTLLTNDMTEENQTQYEKEGVEIARSHVKQYLKCCPICSQVIRGRGNMLKHMKECHKDCSYKPFACERCVKTMSAADLLHVHRT